MQLLSASDLLPPAKHSALLYETVDEFLATIGPFVATGMAQGTPSSPWRLRQT
jgi:hypothetical protein